MKNIDEPMDVDTGWKCVIKKRLKEAHIRDMKYVYEDVIEDKESFKQMKDGGRILDLLERSHLISEQDHKLLNMIIDLCEKFEPAAKHETPQHQSKQQRQPLPEQKTSQQQSSLSTTTRAVQESDNPAVSQFPGNNKYIISKGICVIFCNSFKEQNSDTNRGDTSKDVKKVKLIFEWLGYEVIIHNDCGVRPMETEIANTAIYVKDHVKPIDSIVLFFISHGNCGSIFGNFGEKLSHKDILSHFNKSFEHIPKKFFFITCQTETEKKENVKCIRNSLIVRPCLEGQYSIRDETVGVYFIESMFKSLNEYRDGESINLVEFLINVTGKVSNLYKDMDPMLTLSLPDNIYVQPCSTDFASWLKDEHNYSFNSN